MSDQPSTQEYAQAAPASAPPAPPQEPKSPAATAPAPRRKRRGCLVATIVAALLLLGVVAAAAFMFLTAGKPTDLGVRYTRADYFSAAKKVGLAEKGAAATGFSTDVRYSGTKKIDAVLTSAEVSALLNYSHKAGWPISGAQVRFSGANGVELSAYVAYAGVRYPVYAKGTAAISGGTVSGMATSASVFGVSVPSQYLGPGSEFLAGAVNSRLDRLGTLDITSAQIVDGGLHLVGTGPATAEPVTP